MLVENIWDRFGQWSTNQIFESQNMDLGLTSCVKYSNIWGMNHRFESFLRLGRKAGPEMFSHSFLCGIMQSLFLTRDTDLKHCLYTAIHNNFMVGGCKRSSDLCKPRLFVTATEKSEICRGLTIFWCQDLNWQPTSEILLVSGRVTCEPWVMM